MTPCFWIKFACVTDTAVEHMELIKRMVDPGQSYLQANHVQQPRDMGNGGRTETWNWIIESSAVVVICETLTITMMC